MRETPAQVLERAISAHPGSAHLSPAGDLAADILERLRHAGWETIDRTALQHHSFVSTPGFVATLCAGCGLGLHHPIHGLGTDEPRNRRWSDVNDTADEPEPLDLRHLALEMALRWSTPAAHHSADDIVTAAEAFHRFLDADVAVRPTDTGIPHAFHLEPGDRLADDLDKVCNICGQPENSWLHTTPPVDA